MKRLFFVLVGLLAISLFSFADTWVSTADNAPEYPLFTAANPTPTVDAGDIGGTQDMTNGVMVPVTVDESVQAYVDK